MPKHPFRAVGREVPESGARHACIKVQACGVCYHDVSVRAGVLRAGVAMPCIPGHEVSGVIAQQKEQ